MNMLNAYCEWHVTLRSASFHPSLRDVESDELEIDEQFLPGFTVGLIPLLQFLLYILFLTRSPRPLSNNRHAYVHSHTLPHFGLRSQLSSLYLLVTTPISAFSALLCIVVRFSSKGDGFLCDR